ncbi:MAG: preprotein translocase subunit SecG [Magnetococcales bacterium]|nr:preprotein translocase subunit SecG [Magnetococcales bacterium]
MDLIVTVAHIIVCLTLIFVVLLQKGSGADMGSAFGGGSSESVFGARGSGSFLGKLTAGIATIYMLTSLTLAFFTNKQGDGVSVMEKAPIEQKVVPVEAVPTSPLPPKSGSQESTPVEPSGSKPIPLPSE